MIQTTTHTQTQHSNYNPESHAQFMAKSIPWPKFSYQDNDTIFSGISAASSLWRMSSFDTPRALFWCNYASLSNILHHMPSQKMLSSAGLC